MVHKNQKYNLTIVKKEAQKYDRRKDFESNARPFYAAAYRNGWLSEVCAHMKSDIIRWTKDMVLNVAYNYKNISSFIGENSGAYKHAIRHKYIIELNNIYLNKHKNCKKYWTKEKIIEYTSQCKNYSDFFKSGAYHAASKLKILEEIQSILPKEVRIPYNKIWNINKCIDLLKGVKSRIEFMKKFPGAWSYLQSNNMLKEAYGAVGIGYLSGTSSLELDLMNWLSSHGIKFEHKSRILKDIEIDIFIPDKNIGIEINGLYWHSEEYKDKNYHLNKTSRAAKLGIHLIHIFEDQILERNDQVKNFILSKVKDSNRIYARDCEISIIKNDKAKDFFNKNHIQGSSHGSLLNISLSINNKLLGVMSFGIHHRHHHSNEIILTRLAYEYGTVIIGGASKMLSAAKLYLKEKGIKKIISWSDTSITDGNVYKKLDFTLEAILPPDYSYTKQRKRFSKQSLKKTKEERLTGKTERELRLEQGYLRIWDCGKKRWILNLD
jgi:hypothetical protein